MSNYGITNANQLHIRLLRHIPQDLARAISPKRLQDLAQQAWDNGWRDPEWISNCAVAGTAHPDIRDSAALYVSQLTALVTHPCPEEATPTPPPVEWALTVPREGIATNPTAWANRCRSALNTVPSMEGGQGQ